MGYFYSDLTNMSRVYCYPYLVCSIHVLHVLFILLPLEAIAYVLHDLYTILKRIFS